MLITGNLLQYTSSGHGASREFDQNRHQHPHRAGHGEHHRRRRPSSNGTLVINQTGAVNGQTGNAGGGLSLGSTSTAAALSYLGASGTGAGETSPLALILAGTTGAGMSLGNQQANSANTAPTALMLSSSVAATGAGSKSLLLGGFNNLGTACGSQPTAGIIQNNSIVNAITGVIQDN